MGDSSMEKRDTVQIHLRVSPELSTQFREVADAAERDLSAQFKVIFKEWLAFTEKGSAQPHGAVKVDVAEEPHPRIPRRDAEQRRRGAA